MPLAVNGITDQPVEELIVTYRAAGTRIRRQNADTFDFARSRRTSDAYFANCAVKTSVWSELHRRHLTTLANALGEEFMLLRDLAYAKGLGHSTKAEIAREKLIEIRRVIRAEIKKLPRSS